jgi:hypothetical protein
MKFMNTNKVSLMMVALTFLCVMFSLVMSSEKGLFADYLIAIFLLYSIINKNGNISVKLTFAAVIVLALFLIPSYIYFMGDSDIMASIFSIISRGLTGSIQPGYHYLEFFPEYHNWLYGRSLPNPGGLLPFTSYNLTFEIKKFVDVSSSSEVVGSMPAIYWGEIYANFGYYGLILIPPLIGFMLYCLNLVIFRIKINPLSAALFVWLIMHYKNLSITSLSMYILDTNLYVIVIIYIIISTGLKAKNSKFTGLKI